VTGRRSPIALTQAARVDFWRIAVPLAPFVAGAVPFFATLLLGGFDGFQFVGRDASPLAAFGILGTICFPFAAYYLADRKHREAMNALARSWPTASGVIRSSAIERKMTGWVTALWALDVRYDYTVDGRPHSATTLGFADRFVADKELVFRLAEKYPAGTPVTVRYEAGSPEVAVLETDDGLARGNGWRFWLTFGAPFVAALAAAVRQV
jgi:hypothetical protein